MSIEPQEIGRRIRAARELRGWTQMTFAHEAQVSISSVQRWESGVMPPVRELIRLAGVLGIEPEQLVELEPNGDAQVVALREEVAELRAVVEQGGQDTVKALDALKLQVRALNRKREAVDPPAKRAAR